MLDIPSDLFKSVYSTMQECKTILKFLILIWRASNPLYTADPTQDGNSLRNYLSNDLLEQKVTPQVNHKCTVMET